VVIVLLAAVTSSAVAGSHRSPQWAIIDLWDPTLIGETIVQGPVFFVHDESRLRRGEPCTSVELFDPATGPCLKIASFDCVLKPRPVVSSFTVTTRPNAELGYGSVLTEFQFAGEDEGHVVLETWTAR
jgi:hypothetical protein